MQYLSQDYFFFNPVEGYFYVINFFYYEKACSFLKKYKIYKE